MVLYLVVALVIAGLVVFCSLLNIVLDLLFVVVLKTGVAGAALATVLSEAIAAILCIIYAFIKVPQFKMAFVYRKPDRKLLLKTLQVGLPTGLQYALIYVSSIILQRIVNGFGESVIGAFFVTNSEIISIAASGIRITGLFLIALGGVQILRYMLNGAGDSLYALMNGVVEVIARVAFAISLTAIPLIGMWGIWLTTGLTWAVTAIFALIHYKHGAWKNKKLV